MRLVERHGATLRKVRLDTVLLTSSIWPRSVCRMRSWMQLNGLLLEGILFSGVPSRNFDLGMIKQNDARLPEDLPQIEQRKAI